MRNGLGNWSTGTPQERRLLGGMQHQNRRHGAIMCCVGTIYSASWIDDHGEDHSLVSGEVSCRLASCSADHLSGNHLLRSSGDYNSLYSIGGGNALFGQSCVLSSCFSFRMNPPSRANTRSEIRHSPLVDSTRLAFRTDVRCRPHSSPPRRAPSTVVYWTDFTLNRSRWAVLSTLMYNGKYLI